MRKAGTTGKKHLETTIREILKSKSQSKIYIYLLYNSESKTNEIIKGTNLHPSTVRETLVKMHQDKLIIRKKLQNDCIGKNPYLYSPIPPFQLIRRYARDIENRLNNLVSVSKQHSKKKSYPSYKIQIAETEGLM